ncbi:hypothetical protein B0G73_1611 [Paraburkholderia sp. BL25I1N1]|nr:hypothetical protein B0G73_1611 [Paraburkholderia sp. BL25I1N1]
MGRFRARTNSINLQTRYRESEMSQQVPEDFPRNVTPASLPGAHPKLAGRLIDGKFVVGLTEEERFERWDICEDLAQQLIGVARKEASKYPEHSRDVTLERVCVLSHSAIATAYRRVKTWIDRACGGLIIALGIRQAFR